MKSLSRIGIESYTACIFFDTSAVFAIFWPDDRYALDTEKSKPLGSFFPEKISGPKEGVWVVFDHLLSFP